MALFNFEKKEKEPEYFASSLNTPLINYRVYYMSGAEKVTSFLLAFVVGAVAGWVFYGDLFMVDGERTINTYISNAVICTIVGIVAGIIFIYIRRDSLREDRQNKLRTQFREYLSSLNSSFAAGDNVMTAFRRAKADIISEYGEDAYIVSEAIELSDGLDNNVAIDELLNSLAYRSDIDDIKSFCEVFLVCNQKGGDMKSVVRNTYDLIGEKIAIAEEIETKLTSNKMQQNVMSVVPIFVIAFLRVSSSTFAASFATPMGILTMTIAIGIFIGAYFYGRKVISVVG